MTKLKRGFSFKLKQSVDPRVVDFANMQSNLTDTIIYLFEKEIAENGVRNLQQHIPAVRNMLGPYVAPEGDLKDHLQEPKVVEEVQPQEVQKEEVKVGVQKQIESNSSSETVSKVEQPKVVVQEVKEEKKLVESSGSHEEEMVIPEEYA